MRPKVLLLVGAEVFAFAVPPLDLRVEERQDAVSVRLIDFGEIFKMRERNCARISFSTFFPSPMSHFFSFLNPALPNECVEKIKKWKNNKTRLVFKVPEFNIAYPCYIESFTPSYEERTGDIKFEIALVESRDPRILDEETGLYERWI